MVDAMAIWVYVSASLTGWEFLVKNPRVHTHATAMVIAKRGHVNVKICGEAKLVSNDCTGAQKTVMAMEIV